jgi:hypothetical protein
LFVPLLTCACHTSRVVPLAPKETGALPEHTWVVRLGGQRVPLDGGRLTRDSVTGTLRDGRRFAASRDSLVGIEERHISAGRTAGLAGGLFVGLLAAFVALAVAAGPGLP